MHYLYEVWFGTIGYFQHRATTISRNPKLNNTTYIMYVYSGYFSPKPIVCHYCISRRADLSTKLYKPHLVILYRCFDYSLAFSSMNTRALLAGNVCMK